MDESCVLPLLVLVGIAMMAASGEAGLVVVFGPPYLLWMYRKQIARAIWEFHLALGALLVRVVRDLPLAVLWSDMWSDKAVRAGLRFWLACPVLLGVPFVLIGCRYSIWFITLVPSVVFIGCGYYREFLHGPIRHRAWPRFLKEYYLMHAEKQIDARAWTTRS
jgi:hypothetical protein